MSVRSGQSITKKFTTSVFSTGAASNADSLPTGTLYVNGVADAATVTVTNVATGSYKAQVTLPTLAVGDVVDLEISATVSSVAAKGVIWTDTKDMVIDSSGLVDSTTVKAGPSGAATAQTARDLGASVLLSVGTGTGQVNLSSGKVPATLAASDVTGNVAADLQTIKTQTVTCAAGVTVGVYVGGTAAAATATALSTLQTTANTINSATGTYLDATISSRGTSTLTQAQVTGGAYALNSSSFAFNAAMDFTTTQKAATLARVTLVDTTTTNTDMRGTDNAALAATALSTATWTGTLATNLGTLAGHDPGSTLASASAVSALQTTANAINSTVTLNSDTAGTTTLLGRLTSARGGYLDNLNVGGNVSSHADIVNFTQSMPNALVVTSLVYPVEGTDTAYPLTLYIWNENGQLQDADGGIITSTITNAVGTDRSAHFSGWTHGSTGTYTATYTVASNATLEPLVMKFAGTTTTNSVASNFVAVTQPQVNANGSVSFSSTDRTNLTAIYNKLPANNIADETTLTDLSGRVVNNGRGVQAELMGINGHDVAVDTGTAGVVSFVSGDYVMPQGTTVQANVTQINGETAAEDGNGHLRVEVSKWNSQPVLNSDSTGLPVVATAAFQDAGSNESAVTLTGGKPVVADVTLNAAQPNDITFTGSVVVSPSATNATALRLVGNGAGPALDMHSDSGHCVLMYAGQNGFDIFAQQNAIYAQSVSSDAVVLYAGHDSSGLHIWGGQSTGSAVTLQTNGAGCGLDILSGGEGWAAHVHGLKIDGAVNLEAGLNITQSIADTAAVSITGNGTGEGVHISAGQYGDGLKIASGSTSGRGIYATSATSDGAFLESQAGGCGLVVGGSYGLVAYSSGTNPGFGIYGGTGSPALDISASGDNEGVKIVGSGTGKGLSIQGAVGVWINGVSSDGIQIGSDTSYDIHLANSLKIDGGMSIGNSLVVNDQISVDGDSVTGMLANLSSRLPDTLTEAGNIKADAIKVNGQTPVGLPTLTFFSVG